MCVCEGEGGREGGGGGEGAFHSVLHGIHCRLQEQCTGLALEVEGMSGEVLATQTKLTSLTKKVSDDELQLQQITDAKQAAVTGKASCHATGCVIWSVCVVVCYLNRNVLYGFLGHMQHLVAIISVCMHVYTRVNLHI